MIARASYARVTALLHHVDALPAEAVGALLIGPAERPCGMILVEHNRICWIAAAGMGARLRDLLHAYDSVADALKHHTVESLLALEALHPPAEEWALRWVGRADGGYRPEHTFSTLEVLTAVGAGLTDDVGAELAADHLRDVEHTRCHAVAFVVAGGQAIFIGHNPSCALSVVELAELGSWSLAALEASGGFSPLVAHSAVRAARSGGVVAWRMDAQVCAAVCTSPESLTRLATYIGNHELPIVISCNLPLLQSVRGRETTTQ